MPNRFQIKRTTTTGLLPNVTNSSNTSYIAAGELAINLTDRKLLSSNGSATFEIGANLASISVAGISAFGNTTITGFANVSTTATIGTGFTLTSGNANFDSGVLFVDGTNNRVGVNNTTPGHALSVTGTLFAGNTTINGDLAIGGVDAGPNFISFRGTTGDSPNSYNHTYIGERIHTATEASELFLFKGNDPSSSGPDRVRIGAAEFRVDTYTPALSGTFEAVASSANLTNKFIVTNAGNVGIGNSTPSSKLVVAGAVELGNTTVTGFANVSSTLAAGNTTITGFITATGDITAFFSDDRLKDRYSNIPNAVEKVKSLNGFYYEPNITAQDLGYQKEMHVGVSAQEVNAIMPEVVAPAPIDNKYMTVKYDRLIPLLIEAIKEQQTQIDELKAQLNKD